MNKEDEKSSASESGEDLTNGMADDALISYCESHCETERALFSEEQGNRMIHLAGYPDWCVPKVSGWISSHGNMQELCKTARARATQPVVAPTAGDALPEPVARLYVQNGYRRASVLPGKGEPLFSADQMRTFRRAALANQPAPTVPAATGTAKRMRDLAAGLITGEIKQFEYSLAADRIEDLEGLLAQSKAAHQPAQEQAELRYTRDGALAECPCCGSLDVGGAHDTVHCYGCGLTVTGHRPLQNAIDIWNRRAGRPAPAKAPQAPVAAPQQAAAPGLVPKFEGQFDSHQDWVNRAGRVLTVRREPAICVDALGRRCYIGADMRRAKDDGAFPVRYFWECQRAAQLDGGQGEAS